MMMMMMMMMMMRVSFCKASKREYNKIGKKRSFRSYVHKPCTGQYFLELKSI